MRRIALRRTVPASAGHRTAVHTALETRHKKTHRLHRSTPARPSHRTPCWRLTCRAAAAGKTAARLAGTGGFAHPGLLHTQADFDRMAAKYTTAPWSGSWNLLVTNPRCSLTYTPNPQAIPYCGYDGTHPENYGRLFNDVAAAYLCAVRWKVTGDVNYGELAVTSSAALPTAQWVHVAVTLAAQVATLYVNGVAVGSTSGVFLPQWQLGGTAQNWIGRSHYAGDPYFNGKADDFRIYRGALSAAEVAALVSST